MRGIILAGGTGSRLWPSTLAISKQLLPVYDKPMIYYPLSTLMLAGITEFLIICKPGEQELFFKLLKDGRQWGISLQYKIQEKPEGIAQAFILGEDFLAGESAALILGDNIFYGPGLGTQLQKYTDPSFDKQNFGGQIFAYQVSNPQNYGVVSFTKAGKVTSIVEKPAHPVSSFAVPGLYFYDNSVVGKAKKLTKSLRGELEISDLNSAFLKENKLQVAILPRGTAWLDTGTPDTLLAASNFVNTVEQRQGMKIAAVEEVAWRQNLITDQEFQELAKTQANSDYGKYLLNLLP